MAKTVAIADDSRFIIDQLAGFLTERMGLTLAGTARDGGEAVDLYRRTRPDLLSLDLNMPKMRGREVIQTIIGEFPDANILIVSAVRGDEIVNCLRAGARGYMEKPLRFDTQAYIDDFIRTINETFETKDNPPGP